jgi:inorganic pyrophosphatase
MLVSSYNGWWPFPPTATAPFAVLDVAIAPEAIGCERMTEGPVNGVEEALVCVVEIPKGGRNKYEYDPALGGIKFDRLLESAATYPTDYGYLTGTQAEDGDPLDALVCLYEPTFPGCLIPVKPLGMFKMRDEKGIDNKIICVPFHDPYWNHYERLEDLPLLLRQEIEQFFSIYKKLEKGKEVQIGGWCSREEALLEIGAASERGRGVL